MYVFCTASKTNKWALKRIKPETLLEGKMTKLKLSYFWAHQEKAGLFGKDNDGGEREGSWKRGRPNMRGTDPMTTP